MCVQKGSHTCDTVVATAACRVLRSTGMTVPQGCPSSDVIEAENNKIDALSVILLLLLSRLQIILGHSWLQSSHKFKLSGDSSLLPISSIR